MTAGDGDSDLNESRVDAPPALSAIVLGYRAGDALPVLAERLHADLVGSGIGFELVLVANHDGPEPDHTAEVTREFAADHDNVTVIASQKRGAMGWDMRSGLDAAAGDFLIVIDGDGRTRPTTSSVPTSFIPARGRYVVKGRRSTRADGLVQMVISLVYIVAFAVMFGARGIWDVNGRPKGITRKALGRMRLEADDWFIDAEIVLEARRCGSRHCRVPGPLLGERGAGLVRRLEDGRGVRPQHACASLQRPLTAGPRR